MNKPEKAFIFDLNGTMIDDMAYHTRAWYRVLNDDLGAGLSIEQVKAEMYGKNEELLIRVFGDSRFSRQEMDSLSVAKEKRYQQEFGPHLALIPGLSDFLEKAYMHGTPMAIGSAAIPFNIDFVLDNLKLRHYFKAIVSADDVRRSKPDPETYLMAADLLQVKPSSCIVFEDAPKGVESAMNAGMKCIAITTMHEKNEFQAYPNILHFIKDYTDPVLSGLL